MEWAAIACGDGLFRTPRLRLRRIDERDAAFLVDLLNDSQFIALIGDRQVRTHEDALAFLEYSIRDSYRTHGFGPYLIECLGEAGAAAGLCGLYRRDYLTCADIGYALLPAYRGRGIAREAALATLEWGRATLGLDEVVGITSMDNLPSARVLEHCAMRRVGRLRTRVGGLESELYIPRAATRPADAYLHHKLAALISEEQGESAAAASSTAARTSTD